MYYELALISVLVAGGYWGFYFVRHETTRFYGALQLLAAALAGLGLLGAKLDKPELGVPGAIGVGGGVCLLLIAPLARGAARRFAASERFGAAQRMLDLAEVLAPGSGVADEKALLGAMREIRDGNIEQAVEALTAAKSHAPADARLAIDERIAMLYLAAYRWGEAIAHAEEHLFGAIPLAPGSPAPAGHPLAAPEAGTDGVLGGGAPASQPPSPNVALRRALGIAPPVWVELLGAYGYTGDLDQAARMLARLEEVCADRPDASVWLHRGRLMFLALAGRVGAVQTLVEPRRSRHMKPAARTYWVAVAHERHGERDAAEVAYAKARSRSRGRPRVLIDQALERLAHAKPIELGPTASELVARVEIAPPPAVTEPPRPRAPIAPRIFVAGMAAVAAAITIAIGPTSDYGVLMRAGALVRGLVSDGEWWRLVSAMFVHVGFMHALVNIIGLWLLGRLTEDLFGPSRTLAVFIVAGLGGSVASYLAVPAGLSAGASGAVFGLVGAVFVELTLHRRRYRSAWNRGVWGSLAFVTIGQVGIDLLYPVTDQWAHGAGLAAGAVAGFVFSPHGRWVGAMRHVARVLVLAFAAVAIVAAIMVARTSIADSLSRAAPTRLAANAFSAVVPSSWHASGDQISDPDLNVIVLGLRHAGPLNTALEDYTIAELGRAKKFEFDQAATATDRVVSLPDGWLGNELVVSLADPLDNRQRFRVIVAGRSEPEGIVLVSIYMPETVARAAPAFFTRLIASVQ